MGVIESLQRQAEEEKADEKSEGCREGDDAIEHPDLVGDAVNDLLAEEPKDESQ